MVMLSQRKCPVTTTVEEKGEPKRGIEPMSSAYQPNVLPLGHTGVVLSGVCNDMTHARPVLC